jgi:hypothetical protein
MAEFPNPDTLCGEVLSKFFTSVTDATFFQTKFSQIQWPAAYEHGSTSVSKPLRYHGIS